MSEKQKIYCEILRLLLPIARNLSYSQSRPLWRWPQKAPEIVIVSEILEFIHGIPVTMATSVVDRGDVWFVNNQARKFFEVEVEGLSTFRNTVRPHLLSLVAMLPADLSEKLEWRP